ncbi:hypothetical protein [Kitasatospora sp. NPDC057015]|uniref:hypothetical protein n=1 Tax=Kitasatospora sp. NPDC057015 TaxID=3346001 RepID=UPI00362E0559
MESVTTEADAGPVFRIGMLGPSRVGKTSLVVSLLTDSERLLGGTPVVLRAADSSTRARLRLRRQELDGGLLAKKFDTAVMPGSENLTYFELDLKPGQATNGIRFSLLDFPGTWMSERERRGPEEIRQWDECREFLVESNILIIPIDATVLMEAEQAAHWQSVPAVLETLAVQEIAESWAGYRNLAREEPALVVLAPVKCESYFADNGGYRDDSQLLRERVLDVYARVVELVRLNAPHAQIRYCPVDTLGCVELVKVEWEPSTDDPGVQRPRGTFAVRGKGRISIAGADDILGAVCSLLVEAQRKVATGMAADHIASAQGMEVRGRELKRGFFRHILNTLNGNIRANELERGGELGKARAFRAQAQQLQDALEMIAGRASSGRSKVL